LSKEIHPDAKVKRDKKRKEERKRKREGIEEKRSSGSKIE
jgi:hypothetical protein